jgi:murein DD-endopeptidase MepM/ murein hydrolase activator NlpD
MRWTILCLAASLLSGAALGAADGESVRVADSFGLPVGIENGKRYYKARGFRPHGHLGEDWNGVGGGNTDLGDPVHATAHGLVVYAHDFRAGWGNVVIIRHAYFERGTTRYIDSLYGHLDRILVRNGQDVERGEKIGTIGTGHGRYPAHLHFEIRKDIRVGMYRSMFARDYSVYHDPTQFVLTHQRLSGEGRMARVPINTFPNQRVASREKQRSVPAPINYRATTGVRWSVSNASALVSSSKNSKSTNGKRGSFQVDRFGDMRGPVR